MHDNAHLAGFPGGGDGGGAALHALVCHVDCRKAGGMGQGFGHLAVGDVVIIVGFDNFNPVAGEALFMHPFTEAGQPPAVPVEFQIAAHRQHPSLGRDALADQLGGDASAFVVVLPDEAYPFAVRQIGIEGDNRDALIDKGTRFGLNAQVVDGAQRNPAYPLCYQRVQPLPGFAGNVGAAFVQDDFDIELAQLVLCRRNPAQYLGTEIVGPVRQQHAQPQRREILLEGLPVHLARGHVTDLGNGVQHPDADFLLYIRTVVQYPVHRPARNPRAFRYHLNCRTFAHT